MRPSTLFLVALFSIHTPGAAPTTILETLASLAEKLTLDRFDSDPLLLQTVDTINEKSVYKDPQTDQEYYERDANDRNKEAVVLKGEEDKVPQKSGVKRVFVYMRKSDIDGKPKKFYPGIAYLTDPSPNFPKTSLVKHDDGKEYGLEWIVWNDGVLHGFKYSFQFALCRYSVIIPCKFEMGEGSKSNSSSSSSTSAKKPEEGGPKGNSTFPQNDYADFFQDIEGNKMSGRFQALGLGFDFLGKTLDGVGMLWCGVSGMVLGQCHQYDAKNGYTKSQIGTPLVTADGEVLASGASESFGANGILGTLTGMVTSKNTDIPKEMMNKMPEDAVVGGPSSQTVFMNPGEPQGPPGYPPPGGGPPGYPPPGGGYPGGPPGYPPPGGGPPGYGGPPPGYPPPGGGPPGYPPPGGGYGGPPPGYPPQGYGGMVGRRKRDAKDLRIRGWRTQYSKTIEPDAVISKDKELFYGLGNCPPTPKTLVDLYAEATNDDTIINFFTQLLRQGCQTRIKLMVPALKSEGVLDVKDKQITFTPGNKLATTPKLSWVEEQKLASAFELHCLSKTYHDLSTTPPPPSSSSTKSAQFLQKFALTYVKEAGDLVPLHFVQMLRHLIKVLRSVMERLHEDVQNMDECSACEKDVALLHGDTLVIMRVIKFVMHGIPFQGTDVQGAFDTWVGKNEDHVKAAVAESGV